MTDSRTELDPTGPSLTTIQHFDRSTQIPHSGNSSESFLLAWMRGVSLAGPHLFERACRSDRKLYDDGEPNPHRRFGLAPDLRLIRRAIVPMSPAERFFLAGLVSFCYVADGGQLLRQSGFSGFSELGRLDLLRRQVIATLILHIQSHFDPAIAESNIDWLPSGDDASPWDILARETRHFDKAPEAFLASWICGVKIAGVHFFGRGPAAQLDLVRDKWDLRPKVGLIANAFASLDRSEQIFLATLVSFYDAADGGELLKRAGFRGFADLAHLDHLPRAVIAGLILNYTGW